MPKFFVYKTKAFIVRKALTSRLETNLLFILDLIGFVSEYATVGLLVSVGKHAFTKGSCIIWTSLMSSKPVLRKEI